MQNDVEEQKQEKLLKLNESATLATESVNTEENGRLSTSQPVKG